MLPPTTRRIFIHHIPRPPAEARMTFFDLEEEDLAPYNSSAEVVEYLKSGSQMEILNHFPTMTTISMKFNTATSSSVPVERLFSLGALVLTQVTDCMTNDLKDSSL